MSSLKWILFYKNIQMILIFIKYTSLKMLFSKPQYRIDPWNQKKKYRKKGLLGNLQIGLKTKNISPNIHLRWQCYPVKFLVQVLIPKEYCIQSGKQLTAEWKHGVLLNNYDTFKSLPSFSTQLLKIFHFNQQWIMLKLTLCSNFLQIYWSSAHPPIAISTEAQRDELNSKTL